MEVLNFYKEGCKIPEGAVYIGRAMPKLGLAGSIFANPNRLHDTKNDEERAANLKLYRGHLWDMLQAGKIKEEDLLRLENKNVVCFCAPKPCHGNVVLDAVNWATARRDAPTPPRKPSP